MRAIIALLVLLVLPFVRGAEEAGKVWVQSEPAGADILVMDKDNKPSPTGSATPAMIRPPKGAVNIVLRKAGYKDTQMLVEVGEGILKPEKVKLELPSFDVDVIYAEEGWVVYVDDKPAVDKSGQPATPPCTLVLTTGRHKVVLAKEGFVDLLQPVEVKAADTVEIKMKTVKGVSAVMAGPQEKSVQPPAGKTMAEMAVGVVGHYTCKDSDAPKMNSVTDIYTDGTCCVTVTDGTPSGWRGTWVFRNGELRLNAGHWGSPEVLVATADPRGFVGKRGVQHAVSDSITMIYAGPPTIQTYIANNSPARGKPQK